MTCSTWHPPRPLTEFCHGLHTDGAGWLAGANGGYLGFKFLAWRSSRFPYLPGAAISLSGPHGQIDHRNNHEDECQQLRPRAYGNIAVLYQAHYASRAVEEAFVREQIPHTVYSDVPFFARREIKDALSYLRLIAAKNDLDFRRVANVPKRNLGRRRMKYLEETADREGTVESVDMTKRAYVVAFDDLETSRAISFRAPLEKAK